MASTSTTSAAASTKRPVLLCILDGWGEREETDDNAVRLAQTPTWDKLRQTSPFCLLKTDGIDVGLPEGQFGNSEVGHLNIGAGRIVFQDLPRIDQAIENGELQSNRELKLFIEKLKSSNGTCHILGLMSPGGVHAHQNHITELCRILDGNAIPVCVHGFLDGRDTPPQSAAQYVQEFERSISDFPHCQLATLCGRYFAMDRDKRWERVEKAYHLLLQGRGETMDGTIAAIEKSYEKNIGDEFLEPLVAPSYSGMSNGDGLLMANFRADRARQILQSLVDPSFDEFERSKTVEFAARLGMVSYSDDLDAYFPVLFPATVLENVLGKTVSDAELSQLRLAETEKYAHVTYFLNGGEESPFNREDRILVPSPKVATYDLKPEMSAPELTDELVKALTQRTYDLIVINYANGDMVGHTGSLDAAIRAAEVLDGCLKRVLEALHQVDGTMLLTADHGNFELMRDPVTGGPHTAHTLNPVPALLVNGPSEVQELNNGRLADIAPTLLKLLGVNQPPEMTGSALF